MCVCMHVYVGMKFIISTKTVLDTLSEIEIKIEQRTKKQKIKTEGPEHHVTHTYTWSSVPCYICYVCMYGI